MNNVIDLLDRPIAFHRVFVPFAGVKGAVFLSQLLYWSKRGKDPDGWIYKTYREWTDETGLTERELDSIRNRLKSEGIIEEELRGVPPIIHYRIIVEKFHNLLQCNNWYKTYQLDGTKCTNSNASLSTSLTETTTETTIKFLREGKKEDSGLLGCPINDPISEPIPSTPSPAAAMPSPSAAPNSTTKQRDLKSLAKRFDTAMRAENLYNLYPRHVGKHNAIRAIEKALEVEPYDKLYEAVYMFSRIVAEGLKQMDVATREERRKFIPHPASWFNAGRYKDDVREWKTEWRMDSGAKKGLTDVQSFDIALNQIIKNLNSCGDEEVSRVLSVSRDKYRDIPKIEGVDVVTAAFKHWKKERTKT